MPHETSDYLTGERPKVQYVKEGSFPKYRVIEFKKNKETRYYPQRRVFIFWFSFNTGGLERNGDLCKEYFNNIHSAVDFIEKYDEEHYPKITKRVVWEE